MSNRFSKHCLLFQHTTPSASGRDNTSLHGRQGLHQRHSHRRVSLPQVAGCSLDANGSMLCNQTRSFGPLVALHQRFQTLALTRQLGASGSVLVGGAACRQLPMVSVVQSGRIACRCLVGGSLFRTCISIQLCVENTFGLRFRVVVQASVYSPLIKHIWNVVPCYIKNRFKHVWIVDPCLRTSIVSIPEFQTLDQGSMSVCKHLSSVTFDHTRLDWGTLLCTGFCLHPCF